MTYDIYDAQGHLLWANKPLEDAANAADVDRETIEWAIEEYGRCDGVDRQNRVVTVVEHGDPWPEPVRV